MNTQQEPTLKNVFVPLPGVHPPRLLLCVIFPTQRNSRSTHYFEQILPKKLCSVSVAHPEQMCPVTPLFIH